MRIGTVCTLPLLSTIAPLERVTRYLLPIDRHRRLVGVPLLQQLMDPASPIRARLRARANLIKGEPAAWVYPNG